MAALVVPLGAAAEAASVGPKRGAELLMARSDFPVEAGRCKVRRDRDFSGLAVVVKRGKRTIRTVRVNNLRYSRRTNWCGKAFTFTAFGRQKVTFHLRTVHRGKARVGPALRGCKGMNPRKGSSVCIRLGAGAAPAPLPCDIYASGGTPCVAAHSTTRALYVSYNGPLYQVRRASDNATRDIGMLGAGVYANAAAQDSFCAGTSCLITIIYDQTGRNNHLTQAPPGGFDGPAPGGYDNLANATAAPVTLNGNKAYGVFVSPGTGYRNNSTNGIATEDQPEGMYAIFDGTHYNGACCFNYGNAETNSRDNGNGRMEAIYFGDIKGWGHGSGNGPWVMADLENGLFAGANAYNPDVPTVNHRFLTAIIKGEPNHWAIRAGNAQAGGLSTYYDGPRPNVEGYNPMRKEGAIILGIGGDNSNGSAGTFYEGVMTSGYPSAVTEDAVQASIVRAGYAPA